jgi:hypothetical protein
MVLILPQLVRCLHPLQAISVAELLLCRFVDRDMFMRFHWKLAIGHSATQKRFGSTLQASDVPQYGKALPGLGPLCDEGEDRDKSDSCSSTGSCSTASESNDEYQYTHVDVKLEAVPGEQAPIQGQKPQCNESM